MKKGRKLLSLILAVLMCFSCLIISTQAASFTPRLTEPSISSPYWIHTSYGGLNSCIVASGNSVLPNCVGYAWGRAYEILNKQPDLSRGNAGDWFAYNKNRYNNGAGGYPYSTDITKPKLGAIACWSEANNAGHVAVVEQINGNQIVTSDSGWGYKRFWTTNRSTSSSTLSENGKIFQGYIYLLSDSDIIQEPTSIIYPTSGAIYKIAAGVGNNQYLDFACTNDNVQIYENCDGHSNPDFVKSQYFKLTHVGDGWYTVTNTGNGKAMDVDNWTPDPETNVHQYTLHNGDNQLFRFYDAGNGYCYIKSKLGCYVDVKWGDNVNNTNVWMYIFNGNNSQKWKLQGHSHSYSSSVTTQPTCTKTGVRTYNCYCGNSYTGTIAKTSHNSNTTIPAVASTCTKTGLTEGKKCSVCGTVTVTQQTVEMKSHNSNTTISAVAPTCRETGLTEGKKCSVCGTVTVAQQVIDKVDCVNNDGDDMCDYCEKDMPTNEPDATDCSCSCHKGGISGLIFKIIIFFQRIFGMNKECKCGIAHY